MIDIVINTPTKGNDSKRDGFRIRRAAIEASVDLFTSLDTVKALLMVMDSKIDFKDIDVYNLGGSHEGN